MNANDLRAAIRRSCGCCGLTVLGFDEEFVRRGLCSTCRGSTQNSLGASGADMLEKAHLSRKCPVNAPRQEGPWATGYQNMAEKAALIKVLGLEEAVRRGLDEAGR